MVGGSDSTWITLHGTGKVRLEGTAASPRHIKQGFLILREKTRFVITKANRNDITDANVLKAIKTVPADEFSPILLLKSNAEGGFPI